MVEVFVNETNKVHRVTETDRSGSRVQTACGLSYTRVHSTFETTDDTWSWMSVSKCRNCRWPDNGGDA